jgi:hypothetical protein
LVTGAGSYNTAIAGSKTNHQSPITNHEGQMREYKIAAIPGDGIGIEVIAAGLKVLEVLAAREGGFRLAVEHFPWGSDYYLAHGHYIPEGGSSA